MSQKETAGGRAVGIIRRMRDFAAINHFKCTDELTKCLENAEKVNQRLKDEITQALEAPDNGCKN